MIHRQVFLFSLREILAVLPDLQPYRVCLIQASNASSPSAGAEGLGTDEKKPVIPPGF